jgi:3-methyladenine DNA glycosylase AlkD
VIDRLEGPGRQLNAKDEHSHLARLTSILQQYAQPSRAISAQKDKDSQYTFLAIRVPVLRRVATKEFRLSGLSAHEKLLIYDYIWNNAEFYEVMSIPLLYYRSKALEIENEAFPTISNWIDRIDNWAHCDDLAVIYSYFNHNRKRLVMPFLRKLNKSDSVWKIRASIVALAHYAGKRAIYLSPDEALPFLDPHLGQKNKYIANSVGWILREFRKKYPLEIRNYIAANSDKITGFARRRAGA